MYLYLPASAEPEDQAAEDLSDETGQADLSVIPDALLQRFGPPEFTLALELWPDRKLAQADAQTVLAAIASQGFYLQMPPKVNLVATPDERNVHS